jgi:hypothetical protein
MTLFLKTHLLQTPYSSSQSITHSNVHQMRVDALYAPLRGDPRFEALLKDPKNNAPLF